MTASAEGTDRLETQLLDISTVLLDALYAWTAGATPSNEAVEHDIPGYTFDLAIRLGLLSEPEELPEGDGVYLGVRRVTQQYRDRFVEMLDLTDALEDSKIVDKYVAEVARAAARGVRLKWREPNPIMTIEDYCDRATKNKGRSIKRTGRFVNIIAGQPLDEQPDDVIKNDIARLTNKDWLNKKVDHPQPTQIKRAKDMLAKMSAYDSIASEGLTWEDVCWVPERLDVDF